MKKLFVTLMSLLVLFSFVGLADTETDVDWSGSGTVGVDFLAGDDAVVNTSTSGNGIEGEFHAKDHENNPYNYGVDNVTANIDARVYGGGVINYTHTRTDSKESSYGQSGQVSHSSVWSSNGYAGMIFRTRTNYASMKNSQYGFRNNNQFFASGSNYSMFHSIRGADGDGAYVEVLGSSGNARITSMCSSASGNGFNFGIGCGCYTNSNVDAAGSGTTTLHGIGSNNLEGKGWSMPSGGTYTATWSYDDGADINYTWLKD